MKSLYRSEDFRYTQEALNLETEASEVLSPIFKKYREQGYSPREICQLMQMSVLDLMLDSVLAHDVAFGSKSPEET